MNRTRKIDYKTHYPLLKVFLGITTLSACFPPMRLGGKVPPVSEPSVEEQTIVTTRFVGYYDYYVVVSGDHQQIDDAFWDKVDKSLEISLSDKELKEAVIKATKGYDLTIESVRRGEMKTIIDGDIHSIDDNF